MQFVNTDRSDPSQMGCAEKASLGAGATALQQSSRQDGARAEGLLKRAGEQLPPGPACAAASPQGPGATTCTLVSPSQERANDFTGFIQNRRRNSFLYRHHETHQYGRGQGRCSQQRAAIAELLLPPCHSGRVPLSREKLPSSILPVFQRETQSTPSLPTAHAAQWQCIGSPPIQKANINGEITSVSSQRTGTHLATSDVAFLLLEMSQQVIC